MAMYEPVSPKARISTLTLYATQYLDVTWKPSFNDFRLRIILSSNRLYETLIFRPGIAIIYSLEYAIQQYTSPFLHCSLWSPLLTLYLSKSTTWLHELRQHLFNHRISNETQVPAGEIGFRCIADATFNDPPNPSLLRKHDLLPHVAHKRVVSIFRTESLIKSRSMFCPKQLFHLKESVYGFWASAFAAFDPVKDFYLIFIILASRGAL